MRRFLLKTGLVAGLALILQVVGYIGLSTGHEFKSSRMYYADEFNRAFQERDFDLIALGNSRVLASLDRRILEEGVALKSANLGYSSADVSVSRLTLEAYLSVCRRVPKVVLLEVSWFTFNRARTTLHSITGDLVLEDPWLFRYLFRYQPAFWRNWAKTVRERVAGGEGSGDYGSRQAEKDLSRVAEPFNEGRFEKVFPDHRAGVDALLREDFEEIVSLCEAEQILLVMYTAPESREFSLAQEDRGRIRRVLNGVPETHRGVAYLDYSLGGGLYQEAYERWVDGSHHVVRRDLFSRRLSSDLLVELEKRGMKERR